MKTAELTGVLLDYWVAKAEGIDFVMRRGNPSLVFEFNPEMAAHEHDAKEWKCYVYYQPSTSWAQGGPIIDREKIDAMHIRRYKSWTARIDMRSLEEPPYTCRGETFLIAAMRAYVGSKFGEEVPDEV